MCFDIVWQVIEKNIYGFLKNKILGKQNIFLGGWYVTFFQSSISQ